MKQRHRKHRRPVRQTKRAPSMPIMLFKRWVTLDEAVALFADPVDPEPKPA